MTSLPEHVQPDEEADVSSLDGADRWWCREVDAALTAHPAVTGLDATDRAVATRHPAAFPASFRQTNPPAAAADDIVHLLRLRAVSGDRTDLKAVRLHRRADDREDRLRLRLYQRIDTLILSDAVSVLENFGFKVADCYPHGLELGGESLGHIHDFLLGHGDSAAIDALFAHAATIDVALEEVLNGTRENDPFNLLISRLGLCAEETGWLRALYRYLRQTGIAYSVPTAVDALVGAPAVTRGLIGLFRARHEPNLAQHEKMESRAAKGIVAGLAGVAAINHDRLLRALRDTVLAIVRTNAFARESGAALAFKFDSAQVPGLAKPIPWREIFVYSGRVEGIHLRAGPIARGGLRWSDRRDDFRTEVLSLMKAQRVKNAIIVPTGAKGGFYPKRLPDPAQDRDAWAAEGHGAYCDYVAALLSVTDNIVDGAVVHPRGVLVRDKDDPYLVVAADKGTARYSDTANAIAAEQGFWLEDAFASGGAKGYDHKAMGITARGAWISVQRHFAERGIDVQRDSISIAGVGDMSGDVFGNGMLLSRVVRLVAAFDHRHVFLDPAPDPAAAWEERARLFALPNSSWADYDARLISLGGGIFARGQKSIPLSPQVRALLGIEECEIEPDQLIRAILMAPVDLLWFGGIGTYVKGGHEPNSEVGDPANDAVRIDGSDLRARVVAEGANLGCTQAGRIEAGLAGVACNADFIDNSAGVDCSDTEVNIKIALGAARRAGRLDEPARVALLAAMTDEVAELVLEDNRMQALGLSQAYSLGAQNTAACLWVTRILDEGGHLDPATEGLPEPDLLRRRGADGLGLTRSELAVLFSSAKLAVQDALESSSLVDDPALDEELVAAFPATMRGRFREEILGHRLRRQILATRLANRLINRMGFVHPFEIADDSGLGLAEVAIAYVAAERLFRLDEVWQELETANVAEAERIAALVQTANALRPHVADMLGAGPAGLGPLERAERLADHMARLADCTAAGACGRGPIHARPTDRLLGFDGAVGLAEIACSHCCDVRDLACAFASLTELLDLSWLVQAATGFIAQDHWEQAAIKGLVHDLKAARLRFIGSRAVKEGRDAVSRWAAAHDREIARFIRLVERARHEQALSPIALYQVGRSALNLVATADLDASSPSA